MFDMGEYGGFVADYEDHKRALDDIKEELANANEL
jgi:hypothetical protein